MPEAKGEASCSRNPVLSGWFPKMTREPLSVPSVRDSLALFTILTEEGVGASWG